MIERNRVHFDVSPKLFSWSIVNSGVASQHENNISLAPYHFIPVIVTQRSGIVNDFNIQAIFLYNCLQFNEEAVLSL